METINNSKTRYKILAFILTFMVAIAPLGNIRKVKAIAGVDDLAILGGAAIIALIISGLAASGAISGDYTVSAPDLTTITEKAQANLQAAGTNAVEQANRLGEAIKSGAESAKIKALASGAVIYAFLQAIQETLFPKHEVDISTVDGLTSEYVPIRQNNSFILYCKYSNLQFSAAPNFIATHFVDAGGNRFYRVRNCFKNSSLSLSLFDVTSNSVVSYINWFPVSYYSPDSSLKTDYYGKISESGKIDSFLLGNAYTPSASSIASAPSVNLPTRLPQTIINNINNWDGTSDLVLAPPLPYDIPEGQDLVIDPSYVGEGTVNPPSPTTAPDNPPSEEEGITLPWLAALLGLLGLGQLTGIDEGVKSGIDNLVDSITNTAQDVYDGVRDWADTASSTIAQGIEGIRAKLGEIAGVITGGLSLGIESIQSALGSIAETIGHAFDPPSKNVDWDKLKNIQLFNKFPFSIPSDLYYLFGLVAADPVAPCVKIPFDMTFLGGENIDATVDLATYDNVAAIIRNFEFIAFVIGMLYLTKSLIWK